MHRLEHHNAGVSLGSAARSGYWTGPSPEPFWDQTTVFFKTRMRRLLRRIVAAAAPDGLRPDHRDVAMRALMLERAAVAHGIGWHGLSPAQAALVIVLAARGLAGRGPADAERLESAAGRFADRRGLGAFAAGIGRDVARAERRAVSLRPGTPRLRLI